ncbi:DUF4494 domain-containing protein [Duncaniella dubosii]|uniref:DUF4494 domain-containing protein n=1 Tax=Duncaniella dubosii TaxID=2518971 RepID=UPI0023F1D999|nr:DUF4494 domain-containing protein [Duncaniella dubosii]MCX4285013.1 DUF4494 domain-containing protein [Duncaniella dubosii]
MSRFIEAKVSYDKWLENGLKKRVVEPYLVDALSFTEAEARITEEVAPSISGEFSVSAVKKSNIGELFFDDSGDRWYKVKAMFISIDVKSAVEKKKASYFLVQASDFKQALDNFNAGMKGTMADYEIAAISETVIMDVYLAKSETQNG